MGGLVSSPDQKLSCDREPRSGDRYLAWGVSPSHSHPNHHRDTENTKKNTEKISEWALSGRYGKSYCISLNKARPQEVYLRGPLCALCASVVLPMSRI